MRSLILVIVAAVWAYEVHADPFASCPKSKDIKDSMSCLEVIHLMAKCDKCLDTRQNQKRAAAKVARNPQEFVKLMKGQKCNGTEFNCGNTRSYVTEIFEGLDIQYEESKYDDHTPEGSVITQNFLHTPASLRQLFENNKNSHNTIIYHMRHMGTHDHVFTIEQLPNGVGYRYYQSYHDGYSLLAWLEEKNLDKLYNPDTGDLMLWRAVQKHAEEAVEYFSNGTATIYNTTSLKNNPVAAPVLPYIDYVAGYTKEQLFGHFKPAWNRFGKGQIISQKDFLSKDKNSFISILANLVDYFYKHNLDDSSPYSKDAWDWWIALHASPDPTYFPGVPNNAIYGQMAPPTTKYRFEIKSVEIRGKPQCAKNARFILGA